jgi:hypothetical protein
MIKKKVENLSADFQPNQIIILYYLLFRPQFQFSVSPKLEKSPSAIFCILRIILPERVLGKPKTNCILSNLAIGPLV